jgi:hypothetical protein
VAKRQGEVEQKCWSPHLKKRVSRLAVTHDASFAVDRDVLIGVQVQVESLLAVIELKV